MRLPRYQQQVQEGVAPVTQVQADPSAGMALKAVGQGLQQVSQVAGSIAADLYQKQVAAETAKGMADFGDLAAQTWTQFKSLKGDQALQEYPNVQSSLQEALKRTRASIQADDARAQFDRQSRDLLRHYGENFEGHRLQQTREKIQADATAGHVSAINQAATLYHDPAALETLIAQDAGRLAMTGDTADEKRAKIFLARQEVYESAIKAALVQAEEDPGALDQAKALFYANRDALGEKGPGLEKSLISAGLDQQAEAEAMRIEADLTEAGRFTAEAAQEQWEKIGNVRLKDRVVDRVRNRLVQAASETKALVGERWKTAHAAYLKGSLSAVKAIKVDGAENLYEWLRVNAPDKAQRLKDDAERKWRQNQADKDATQRELREARMLARNDFLSRTVDEQATLDLEEAYGATGLDELGLSALKVLQRKAQETVEKGEAVGMTDFVRDAMARGVGTVGASGGKRKRKEQQDAYKAAVIESYYQFEEEKGRKPNTSEKDAIVEALLKKEVQEIDWWPDREEYGFERATRLRREGERPPLPGPETRTPQVVETRRAPDGRILQRLSDGTIRVAQ